MDEVFKYATGWLGLSPVEAKKTPICEIHLALDGHMDYLAKTAVYTGGPAYKPPKKPVKDVAGNIRSVFGRLSKNGDGRK